jgi:hypothetical protein
MSYFIDIIDMTSPLTQLVLEDASASGIVLKWNGGDTKDGMAIVASEFNFDMLTKTAKDAAFIEFFSGDEHRFKVLVKNSVDDSIVWQGYILPDLYNEPYQNGCFFVSFTASDGLPRLKGKYLPEEYYSREKSLIDIFCQCLKLTGVELDLYFNPAIENFINKDWNTIYIDTATFLDKDKKKDAYFILETLLQDTLCLCYQADNRWYIEGINTRQVRQVTYKVYDTTGTLSGTVVYDRLLKSITPLVTPLVTIIPPYNEITITHKKTEPSLPKTLSKEENDGWAIVTGVVGEIYASDWIGHNGYDVKAVRPEFNCYLFTKTHEPGTGSNINYPRDDTKYVSLKEKIFFAKGQKVKIELVFKIPFENGLPTDMNLWKNPFKYEILFNEVVLYSNYYPVKIVSDVEKILFSTSGEAKLSFEHIITEDGLFDIKLFRPFGTDNITRISAVQIQSATVSVIGFKDEEEIKDIINGDFTIDKDIELTYADDKSGLSNGFRLSKLKEATTFFNEIEVLIFNGFIFEGKNYSVVQLEGANLIADNKFQVFRDGVLIEIIDVVYNFNGGEQMVIETPVLYASGSFFVKKYAVDDVIGSRLSWMQWTDAIYKIENTSYSKTVANIYRRMFNEAHEKFDCVALNAVKFNDLILFKYVYVKDFGVLNCSWNLDENKTTLTLGRSHYKDASSTTPGDENIPPIVLAGDDIYLTNTQTTASVLATAYDPDGTIVLQIWTKEVGGFGDIIDTPFALATAFSNLTEDFYTYQIQVTDNDGATAIDSLNIIRIKDYTVTLDLVDEVIDSSVSHPSISRKYKLNVSPALLPGFSLTFAGHIYLSALISGSFGVGGEAYYQVIKNGYVLETKSEFTTSSTTAVTLSYITTDEIFIEVSVSAQAGDFGSGDTAQVNASVTIDTVTIVTGVGNFLGLPIFKEQQVTA